jgi:GT2 family glycosyltransferase
MKIKSTLVIPFYKNEEFIENIGFYFYQNSYERQLFSEILIINDCPDSPQSLSLEAASNRYGFTYLANSKNIGFLLSANIGIKRAIDTNTHIVILNSDTIPTGSCFSELLSVFEFDSMVGCVCPRSNNATIANLWPNNIIVNSKSEVDELAKIAEVISNKMPKLSYTPVINGFCFAIKNSIIKNFSGFDPEFAPGYEEENEYCLRISESGYKVAIANRSFIGHLEGKSFSLKPGRAELMQDHYQKIVNKYPYYPERVMNYFSSPEKKALDMLSIGLGVIDDANFLVDGRVLSCHHNGTMKVIRDIVIELSELGYHVDLIADATAAKFHNIDNLPGIFIVQSPRKYYDFGIKIAQPFEYHSLLTVPLFSKCSINIFFDTIAIDCINSFDNSINQYWNSLDDLYSLIFFISDHSKQQFINRYNPTKAECISLLLPIKIINKIKNSPSIIDGKYVFVIGNKFKHKGMDIVLEQLPTKEGIKYVLLAEKIRTARQDFVCLKPGTLEDDDINSLYENAEEVIFPSFSEGFGYPLIEALQYKKKITCRPLKPFIEIYSKLPIEYKKLIAFVDNFSQESKFKVVNFPTADNFFINEKEYLQKMLKYSENKSKEINYIELKKRLSIAEYYFFKFSNKDNVAKNSDNNCEREVKIVKASIAKKIYLRLMYYKSLQPLLLWARARVAKK